MIRAKPVELRVAKPNQKEQHKEHENNPNAYDQASVIHSARGTKARCALIPEILLHKLCIGEERVVVNVSTKIRVTAFDQCFPVIWVVGFVDIRLCRLLCPRVYNRLSCGMYHAVPSTVFASLPLNIPSQIDLCSVHALVSLHSVVCDLVQTQYEPYEGARDEANLVH